MGPASTVTAPLPRRYNTRLSRRAPLSKRAWTSGPGESSSSRPLEPQSPPTQGPAGDLPPDLSPASIIKRPYFHCSPILGNADCSERDLHNEIYYDLPAFAEDLQFRDSIRLVQCYSLELFMTPHVSFLSLRTKKNNKFGGI